VDRAYRASTRLIGIFTFLLGLTMIAITLARGGGPLAVGVVAGLLFVVLGAIRYTVASRRGE
jgi:cell division protein FtsX